MLLNYTDDGPGPVVVLLHGFPMDNTFWDAQKTTVGSEYRVICPDLRGQGRSAAPAGTYAVDDLADDVLETLDALGLSEPVVVGGLSMGGYLALSIALRAPHRLRGLMLMNTRAGADSEEAARAREDAAAQAEADGTVEAIVASSLPKLYSPTTAERRADVIERLRAMMMTITPRGAAGTLRGLATRPDRTADLAKIAIPTLVLAGADDRTIDPAESQALAAGLPEARLVTIPDAGHAAPAENPAAVNRAILEFLATLPKS